MPPTVDCQVCSLAPAKYKCPKCNTEYCSLSCFKQHKEADCQTKTIEAHVTSSSADQQEQEVVDTLAEPQSPFDKVLQDDAIKYYLKFPALKFHLKSLADILSEPQISGENDPYGRRQVALKKLAQLRQGGREENELVEEFVSRVIECMENK